MSEEVIELPKPILIEDLGMMYPNENSKQKRRYGEYKCSLCGTEFKASTHNINIGHTKSCGCYGKKIISEGINRKHGLSKTRLNRTWSSIKDRTLNINTKVFNDYGGRGITICEEWKNDFMSFYNWAMENGYEENKGLSIDRIDNDGNYEPNNCRWVSRNIQNRNKRIPKNNTSGYRGVCFIEDNNNFRVTITVDRKRINLGIFQTPVEGAIAYNNYIIENNLEGYNLNEIPLVNLIKKF